MLFRSDPLSERERIVGCHAGWLALREFCVNEGLESRPSVGLTGQIRVRLRQRWRPRGNDLVPSVVQLKSHPVQEQDGASDREIVCVRLVRLISPVFAEDPGDVGRVVQPDRR